MLHVEDVRLDEDDDEDDDEEGGGLLYSVQDPPSLPEPISLNRGEMMKYINL